MADATKDVQTSLEKEIETLKKELAQVSKGLSARAADAKDQAGDAVEDLRDKAGKVADGVRKEAHGIIGTARENPKAAAAIGGSVGLVTFALGAVVGALLTSCSRR